MLRCSLIVFEPVRASSFARAEARGCHSHVDLESIRKVQKMTFLGVMNVAHSIFNIFSKGLQKWIGTPLPQTAVFMKIIKNIYLLQRGNENHLPNELGT